MNFIHTQMLSNVSICDELIGYYDSKEKLAGKVLSNGVRMTDTKQKDSFETELNGSFPLHGKYIECLREVAGSYIEKFPFCNGGSPWGITSPINIQHYKPKGGYFQWHTERQNLAEPFVSRHLVFMTYLNDVTDGGETEFFHQGIKLKPQKGLTVIWPADWTHYHRGIASPTQDKYIATGWFNYI